MSRILAAVAVAAVLVCVSSPVCASQRPHHVCGAVRPGRVRCHAIVGAPMPGAASKPGLGPKDVRTAYRFTADPSAGKGQTVAVVASNNAPHVEADLNTFSRRFGLPACSRSNGCFKKVVQRGRTNSFPPTDTGWALEISMDVQWVHAIAPGAKILLVEADDSTMANLMKAVDYARTHARYVSNSWGGPEFGDQKKYDAHFTKDASYFFSSGDDGSGAEYPTSSPNVVSVGGTTLKGIGTSSFAETGWSGSGGGCSHYETATSAQRNVPGFAATGCGTRRATPDLSLVADPASGVAVYDSTPFEGSSGWTVLGGTSASAPMVAGRAAATGARIDAVYLYGSTIAYRDITSGNNGYPCRTGFDMVTGRGSWTG